MENCGLSEVIELTSRSPLPVLQTSSVAVLVVSTQVSPRSTLPGIWINGTSPTRKASKRTPIQPALDGGTPGGDMADAQAANSRPAAQALPL